MRIFFLANFYFDLYKPIFAELKRQGHDVFLQEDNYMNWEYNHRNLNKYKKCLYKFYRYIGNTEVNYWKRKIKENPEYSKPYDVFFCINGVSFSPYLLNHLRKFNPQIKASLYLWDTNKYFDFFRYNDCFDKVLTFDVEDAESSEKVGVLPSFWFPTDPRPVKYAMSIVGSDHDDRAEIVSKVYEQLESAGLKSCFRVVHIQPKPFLGWRSKLKRYKKVHAQQLKDWEEMMQKPYMYGEKVPVAEVIQMIDESECILDTDMPIQTGATERVIWALARGKKVMSTNYNLAKMPFYNKKRMCFIDRENPVIDISFLKSEEGKTPDPYFEQLRIDNWVKNFIYFD